MKGARLALVALVAACAAAVPGGVRAAVPSVRSDRDAFSLRAQTYATDPCLAHIIDHEDNTWDPTRGWNGSHSTAGSYGLPQADPGTKMASAGSDWRTNAVTQLRWAKSYANSRYGSTCNAWAFWQRNYYW